MLCAAAALAMESAFDGVWEVPVPGRPTGIVIEIKTDGSRLTGSFSGPNGRLELRKGSVTGEEAKFDIEFAFQGRLITTRFTGRIENGELILTGEMPGIEQKMTAKRRAADAGAPDWFSRPDAPAEITEWLKSNGMPLGDDLASFRERIKGSRIVAMGEATHGTSEFQVLKRRTFQMLVEQLGYTVFAIESPWANSVAIDDYINGRVDDLRTALHGHYNWWQTEEFAELLRWMRAYNLDPAHRRKLKFAGFDIRGAGQLTRRVLAYLDRVDPSLRAHVSGFLGGIEEFEVPSYENAGAEAHSRMKAEIDALIRAFDERRDNYIRKTSESEWAEARQSAVVLQQSEARARLGTGAGSASRDRSMAENVQWIIDREPPGTKVMLWAHNGHVADQSLPYQSMGSYLRRIYGDALAICGFVFGEGSFRAIPSDGGGARTFTVGPPPRGSLDATFGGTGLPLFGVDLRTATGRAAEWLTGPQISRQIGGEYSEKTAPIYTHDITPRASYDILIYVAKTTGTRPL
ncbi:MAG: erythromycin esterase family protein [Acidobacteria bacterium]|nr:erythromycin esterase family protein [Acidobacteriota bacterium]